MTTRKYFGTDGIRGPAGEGKLSTDNILALAQAVGIYCNTMPPVRTSAPKHHAVIGRDTRASGDMIEAAISAGLTAMGVHVTHLGVLPTPATALMTQKLQADLGIMITASHNPYQDNGIKFFGADGRKLSDAAELAIEAQLDNIARSKPCQNITADTIGVITANLDAAWRYADHIKASCPDNISLKSFNVVLDAAHGAAFETAAHILEGLGVHITQQIGVSPSGYNINKGCGSTRPQTLCDAVRRTGADLGIALDGDADRLIMCDETGQIIDGDQILACLAKGWQETGRLKGGGLVATVMSNLGLERFAKSLGLTLERTAVGDRYVAAKMQASGYNLGGEQSGHILITDHATTGDGMLAAVQLMAEIIRQGRPASAALNLFDPVPQILKNVRYDGPSPLDKPAVTEAITKANTALKDGRVLVRASGTEPVIRVMAEGDDAKAVENLVNTLADFIRSA